MISLLSFLFIHYVFLSTPVPFMSFFFFFNDTATTEIYTLSLHDALPISGLLAYLPRPGCLVAASVADAGIQGDRKSTRLNSSHLVISYAVFCLKKKKKKTNNKENIRKPICYSVMTAVVES